MLVSRTTPEERRRRRGEGRGEGERGEERRKGDGEEEREGGEGFTIRPGSSCSDSCVESALAGNQRDTCGAGSHVKNGLAGQSRAGRV